MTTTLADFKMPGFMRRTLAPLARIIVTDEVEELGLTAQCIDGIELTMRAFPTFLRTGLVVGTFAFEWGAFFVTLRRFSSLPRERQERYFKSWWGSRIGPMHQFAKGVKSAVCLSYWELPLVKERLEYHPEQWSAEVAARRLRDYADDIRQHDELVVAPDPLVPAERLAKKVKHAS
jgi:hypothetical protein